MRGTNRAPAASEPMRRVLPPGADVDDGPACALTPGANGQTASPAPKLSPHRPGSASTESTDAPPQSEPLRLQPPHRSQRAPPLRRVDRADPVEDIKPDQTEAQVRQRGSPIRRLWPEVLEESKASAAHLIPLSQNAWLPSLQRHLAAGDVECRRPATAARGKRGRCGRQSSGRGR
jgi:hypothetical protein